MIPQTPTVSRIALQAARAVRPAGDAARFRSCARDRTGAIGRAFRDENGAYLILFALLLPVLIAAFGLVIETSRMFLLHTQLQNAADAAALGAAGRLDGRQDAIPAARAAVATLDNRATASRFDGNLSPTMSLRFAASLADLDAGSILAEDEGGKARIVAAETGSHSLAASVAHWIGASVAAVPTSARATASSRFAACDVTPLMLCRPDPSSPPRFARGAMYRLPLKTDGTSLAPGDLAALDPPSADDMPALDGYAGNLAAERPRFCYTAHVRPRLATAELVARALNTRFDLYPSDITELAAPPAPNTVKGLVLQPRASPGDMSCRHEPSPKAAKLPRDSCFSGGGCAALAGGLMAGDGQWARAEYWAKNHVGQQKPAGFATLSRFEIYLLELGIGPNAASSQPTLQGLYAPNGPERLPGADGAGTCAARKGIAGPGSFRRRTIEIAIATCSPTNAIDRRTDLSGADFARFFLTEPMDATEGALHLEFIEMLTPSTDDGKLRQIVELVR